MGGTTVVNESLRVLSGPYYIWEEKPALYKAAGIRQNLSHLVKMLLKYALQIAYPM